MLGINNLIVDFKRRGNQWDAYPLFLVSEMAPIVELCLSEYDSRVGEMLPDVNAEMLVQHISDMKLRNGLHKLIVALYMKHGIEDPSKLDVSSAEERETESVEKQIPQAQLRRRLFGIVREQFGGFVSDDAERDAAFLELEMELGFSIDRTQCWSDLSRFKRLKKRPEELTALHVISSYNLGALQTLLFYSEEFTISSERLTSEQVKRLYWLARANGVFVQVLQQEGKWEVRASGPLELFGREHAYGRRLQRYLLSLMRTGAAVPATMQLNLTCNLRRPTRVIVEEGKWPLVLGASGSLDSLMDEDDTDSQKDAIEEPSAAEVLFGSVDSLLEAQVLLKWGNREGWIVKIAEEPVFLPPSTVYLPDFVFSRKDERILCEVVGFWTDTYLQKKREKLIRLDEQLETPFLVVVDIRLSERLNLPPLNHIRVVEFSRQINCADIEREIFAASLSQISLPELHNSVDKLLKSQSGTNVVDLSSHLSSQTAEFFVKETDSKAINDWILAAPHHAIRSHRLITLRNRIEELMDNSDDASKGFAYSVLEEDGSIADLKDELAVAIMALGYQLKYVTLSDRRVIRPIK